MSSFKKVLQSLLQNKVYWILGLIFILGFGLRIVSLQSFLKLPIDTQQKMILTGDATSYHRFAVLIKNKGIVGLFNPKNEIVFNSTVPALTTFRVPGYPLFLATMYSLFGISSIPVFIVQALIDSIVIIFVFLIAKLLSKRNNVSLIAAVLYAISPLALMYALSLFADNVFTFFFTLTLLLFILGITYSRWWLYLLVGVGLGCATLIKPIGVYFIGVIILILGYEYLLRKKEWKKFLGYTALIVCFFYIVITPWQMRNLAVANHYALTYQQGRELLVWRVGTCQAWTANTDRRVLWDAIQQPYLNIKDPFIRSQVEQSDSFTYIKKNLGTFIGCQLRGMNHFFAADDVFNSSIDDRDTDPIKYASNGIVLYKLHLLFDLDSSGWFQVSAMYQLLLYLEYLFIIVGLIRLWRHTEKRASVLLLVLTVLYVATLAGVDGYARYRYPVTPILAVLFTVSIPEVFNMTKHMWMRYIRRNHV